jgi:hypothetical protein
MNKHRGLEFASILLIVVGALAAVWELLGTIGDHFGIVHFTYERFDRGWPLFAIGLICFFLGFVGRAIVNIEKNTRR